MINLIYGAIVVVAAYFVGSIPIGLLFARTRGIDIREVGSGNIGATNVARNLGKKLGAIVLVLDAFKGALPMLVVVRLNLDQRVDPFMVTATGFAAISGHCFPLWLAFRGGKGVATSLGVFLVAAPAVTGIIVGVFTVVYAAFRIVSLGSIAASISFPVLLLAFGRDDGVVTLGIAGAIVVLIKHRGNIARLLRREEQRI